MSIKKNFVVQLSIFNLDPILHISTLEVSLPPIPLLFYASPEDASKSFQHSLEPLPLLQPPLFESHHSSSILADVLDNASDTPASCWLMVLGLAESCNHSRDYSNCRLGRACCTVHAVSFSFVDRRK